MRNKTKKIIFGTIILAVILLIPAIAIIDNEVLTSDGLRDFSFFDDFTALFQRLFLSA